ncbi:MAG TPA: hypothetical protein DDW65_04430 [Firmicutes bacterium]|jgi:hypothetical protein|nr:hypothetical protein [Bacillota bacterium]
MKLILAGWLTVGLALLWDRFLYWVKVKENIRVVLLIPLGEELLKYGVSYYNNLFPPFLFACFGLGEGIYESIHLKKGVSCRLILAAVLPHTFFSLFYLLKIPLWLSLGLAIIIHSIWNYLVLNFKNDCKRSTN